MPIPANTARYEIRGRGPGSEIWMTSFWLQASSPYASATVLQAQLNNLLPDVLVWWNGVRVNIASSYTYTELRAYAYAGGGDTAEFGASALVSTSAGALGASGSPIDTALVVSLHTGFVGKSRRGRMYVPYHNTCSMTTGLITATATDYALITKTLFDSVNTHSADRVSVVSRTLGDSAPVLSVSFDQKPDVQRRRENRLSGGVVGSALLA